MVKHTKSRAHCRTCGALVNRVGCSGRGWNCSACCASPALEAAAALLAQPAPAIADVPFALEAEPVTRTAVNLSLF